MIKLVYQGKNKIIKLEHHTFSQLRNQVKQTYQDLPPDFSLSYLDQDQDQICINSDEDLSILLSAKLKMNKIFIKMSFSQVVNMDSTVTEQIKPNFQVYQSALKYKQNEVPAVLKQENQPVLQEQPKIQRKTSELLLEQKPIIEDVPKQLCVKSQGVQLQSDCQPQEEQNSFLSEQESAESLKKVEVMPDALEEQKVENQEDKPFLEIGQNAIESGEAQETFSEQSQKGLLPKVEGEPAVEENKLTASQEYVATFFQREEQLPVQQVSKKQVVAPIEQFIELSPLKVQKPKVVELIYHNVICSSCKDDYGIIGILYQCILCDDFNLCQNCERLVDHAHSLVQVKKAGASLKKQQIEKKYMKIVFEQPKEKRPMIPAGHYVPSISKEEAERYINTAENYLKEGYERSRKALDDMFLKLSMSHKNPYERGWQEVPLKRDPRTIDEKASQLTVVANISYSEALRFAKKYQKMDFQNLLNTYYNEQAHYSRKK